MYNEIAIGDMAGDICGDKGEVIDIEYRDNGKVWRHILAEYGEDGRDAWPAHPDYSVKM